MREICPGRKFLTGPLIATGHPWDSELVFPWPRNPAFSFQCKTR
jgi:hypothetical protein